MPSLAILSNRAILSCMLIGIDSAFFLGSYGVLRILRISVDWVVWAIGFMLIVAALALGYTLITATMNMREFADSNLFGFLSFLIAIYAAGQWITRHWYIFIKRYVRSFITQQTRKFLLFMRKQHSFFGWLSVVGAVAHMIVYLPTLQEDHGYEIITGFIAIGILALSVVFGIWIWFLKNIRKQQIPNIISSTHSLLTIAFLLAVAIHI